jgi:hypothetical protein
LAGFSLGALHLTKIETITLPVIVGLGLIYFSMVTGFRRRWLWFLLPYLTLLGQGIIHALGIAAWYTETSFSKALPLLSAPLILLFLGLGLALGMPFAASARVRVAARTILTASIWTKLATYVLPAGVGALALFLYFIRPLGIDAIPPGSATDIAAQRVNDLQSFVRLGWFLTPAGILVGSIGWALLLRRELTRRFAFPLVAIGIDTVLTLNQMNITPVYYWAARRWITLVIPGMCLMIAYVLLYLFPKPGKSVIRMVFPVGVTIAIVLGFIQSDRPLLGYVEYRGAVDQIGALAGTIPENGIVLFPDSDAARRFSPPLDYIFGRESFFILPNVAARQSAAQAARQWQDGGRPVYWVATAEIGDPSLIGLAGDIVARQRISLPEKQTTHDRPPGEDGLFQQDLVVWKLRS